MFKKAVPVWAKEYKTERNILLEFSYDFDFSGKFSKIRIAADALYRMYVNGKLTAHGPQRAGKGFWRVDEIDLTHKLERGEKNRITIQVERFGIISFEYVLQPSFLMAELEMDGNIIASYQRPFIEVWNLPHTYGEELQLESLEDIF